MSDLLYAAHESVSVWIDGETEYQFDKNLVTQAAKHEESVKYIMDEEIPNKWSR